MSFFFPDWSTAFSPAFHEDAKAMLETALNKVYSFLPPMLQAHVQGNKPPVIQGRIEVVELSMGKEVSPHVFWVLTTAAYVDLA